MSVRKRTWKTAKGESKEAWIVAYADANGKARIETFARKKEADARHSEIKVDVAKGVHTPLSRSVTVATAARDWLAFVELEGIEKATLKNYRTTVELHIIPRIGAEKLAKLTTPAHQRLPRRSGARSLPHACQDGALPAEGRDQGR
jgi:integrase